MKAKLIENLIDINFNFDDYIVVCVGTPKSIVDSLGPLVGDNLKALFPDKVIGTTSEPYNALTMEEMYKELKLTHPNKKIIAVDACVGTISPLGSVLFRRGPVTPRIGYEVNSLPKIGDYSILGITTVSTQNHLFYNDLLALEPNFDELVDNVYDLSELITEALLYANMKHFIND